MWARTLLWVTIATLCQIGPGKSLFGINHMTVNALSHPFRENMRPEYGHRQHQFVRHETSEAYEYDEEQPSHGMEYEVPYDGEYDDHPRFSHRARDDYHHQSHRHHSSRHRGFHGDHSYSYSESHHDIHRYRQPHDWERDEVPVSHHHRPSHHQETPEQHPQRRRDPQSQFIPTSQLRSRQRQHQPINEPIDPNTQFLIQESSGLGNGNGDGEFNGMNSQTQGDEGGHRIRDLEEGSNGSDGDGCDDGDAVNLNIAVSGGMNAQVGGPGAVPSIYPSSPYLSPASRGMNNQVPFNNPNGVLLTGNNMRSSGNMMISPQGQQQGNQPYPANSMNNQMMAQRRGLYGHPPSRFGDNCTVSDIDTNCFTFTCTIPEFPFQEEMYHGANSCRMIVTPMSSTESPLGQSDTATAQSQTIKSTRYKEFGAITPTGPHRPGDVISHRFEGLAASAQAHTYGVGMVCENEYGVVKYVNRETGQLFTVTLKPGECPLAPESPVVVRDETIQTTIIVRWKLSSDFHSVFDGARCKLVMQKDNKTVNTLKPDEVIRSQCTGDQCERIYTFPETDVQRKYEFRAMCTNAFCKSPDQSRDRNIASETSWSSSAWISPSRSCPSAQTIAPHILTAQVMAVETNVHFQNNLESSVVAYRVGSDGVEQERGVIQAKGSLEFPSHESLVWRVRPAIGGKLLAQFVVAKEKNEVVIEDCSEITVSPSMSQTKKSIDETREFLRARVTPQIEMNPGEICSNVRTVEAEACCSVNGPLNLDDDTTMDIQSLQKRCEQLIWRDARLTKFASTVLDSSNNRLVGCKFDAKGALSPDAQSRCYFEYSQSAESTVQDDRHPDVTPTLKAKQGKKDETPNIKPENQGSTAKSLDLEQDDTFARSTLAASALDSLIDSQQ